MKCNRKQHLLHCCFTCVSRIALQTQDSLPWFDKIHKHNHCTLSLLPVLLQYRLVYEILN